MEPVGRSRRALHAAAFGWGTRLVAGIGAVVGLCVRTLAHYVPEYEHEGKLVGVVTTPNYALAFAIHTLD